MSAIQSSTPETQMMDLETKTQENQKNQLEDSSQEDEEPIWPDKGSLEKRLHHIKTILKRGLKKAKAFTIQKALKKIKSE